MELKSTISVSELEAFEREAKELKARLSEIRRATTTVFQNMKEDERTFIKEEQKEEPHKDLEMNKDYIYTIKGYAYRVVLALDDFEK